MKYIRTGSLPLFAKTNMSRANLDSVFLSPAGLGSDHARFASRFKSSDFCPPPFGSNRIT